MDNAFQSRIQIAIEYKLLGTSSRRQIWEAFIETLPSQDEKDELEPHLDTLKKHVLNGRQIRNAMNLARSFALNDLSNGRMLSYEHLKQAVEETVKFQELFGKWDNVSRRLVNKSRRGAKKDVDSEDDDDDG
jgi:AAA+ superfamily predicted ATPase